MANTCFLSLSFCFLIFINGCFSQTEQAVWRETPSSQQRRLRAKSECRIRSLNALEPTRRVKSEAGYLEFWDAQNEQFDCAGVAAVRHVIQPKGLLLPSFTNAPQLTYILRGAYLLLNLAEHIFLVYENAMKRSCNSDSDTTILNSYDSLTINEIILVIYTNLLLRLYLLN